MLILTSYSCSLHKALTVPLSLQTCFASSTEPILHSPNKFWMVHPFKLTMVLHPFYSHIFVLLFLYCTLFLLVQTISIGFDPCDRSDSFQHHLKALPINFFLDFLVSLRYPSGTSYCLFWNSMSASLKNMVSSENILKFQVTFSMLRWVCYSWFIHESFCFFETFFLLVLLFLDTHIRKKLYFQSRFKGLSMTCLSICCCNPAERSNLRKSATSRQNQVTAF